MTRVHLLAYISELEIICEILESHSDGGEDPSFLGYREVYIDKEVPTFRSRRLRPSSESKSSKRNIFSVSPIESIVTTVDSSYLRYTFSAKLFFLYFLKPEDGGSNLL